MVWSHCPCSQQLMNDLRIWTKSLRAKGLLKTSMRNILSHELLPKAIALKANRLFRRRKRWKRFWNSLIPSPSSSKEGIPRSLCYWANMLVFQCSKAYKATTARTSPSATIYRQEDRIQNVPKLYQFRRIYWSLQVSKRFKFPFSLFRSLKLANVLIILKNEMNCTTSYWKSFFLSK